MKHCVTPEKYAGWCKQFRAYGYDPYNSVDDIDVWGFVENSNG